MQGWSCHFGSDPVRSDGLEPACILCAYAWQQPLQFFYIQRCSSKDQYSASRSSEQVSATFGFLARWDIGSIRGGNSGFSWLGRCFELAVCNNFFCKSIRQQMQVLTNTRAVGRLPLFDADRFLCGFAHIFAGGYEAGYYGYKWAEVMSADGYSAFESVGWNNEPGLVSTGHRYRDTIFSDGGGRPPALVFRVRLHYHN